MLVAEGIKRSPSHLGAQACLSSRPRRSVRPDGRCRSAMMIVRGDKEVGDLVDLVDVPVAQWKRCRL